MAGSIWTRESLCDLVRGKGILLRDDSARNVPVPGWLGEAADRIVPGDSSESIAATHPDDRLLLINVFARSVEVPGEPQTERIRIKVDGTWIHEEVSWLNLLGRVDIDVDGIICTVQPVDGPPISPPDDGDAGDHDAANWMVLTLDASATIVGVEGRIEDILGYRSDEVVGHLPTDFLPAESASDSVMLWLELRSEVGNVNTSRRPWLRKDGTTIWLESSYLNRAEEGDAAVMAVVWDITQRMVEEQALRQREAEVRALAEDFRLLADEVPSAVFRCAADGTVEFHNARWSELLRERVGISRLHDFVSADDVSKLDDTLRELAAAPDAQLRTVELHGDDGASVWRLSLRSMGDVRGGPRSFVGSLSEISATLRLHREARHDPLTGLLNRQGLAERIQDALDANPEGTVVLFVDLDGFKAVNDSMGHHAGDAVLRTVALRLQQGLRPGDAIARYGGDEFVAVCAVSDAARIDAIQERLILALGGPIDLDGGSWQPLASIGVARPEPGDTPETLVRRADLDMFEIKRARSTSRDRSDPGPAPRSTLF